MLGKFIGRTLLILLLVSFSLPVYGETGSYLLSVNDGSHLWIDGDSTLHKYEIKTSTFNLTAGSISSGPSAVSDINAFLSQISGNFVLKIPVNSLDDPEPGFNGVLWSNLKYKEHPDIVFSLISSTATPDPSVAGRYNVTAQGNLTVAGVQKAETISMVFEVQGNTIHVTGTKDLLMTDFGIKPPTTIIRMAT